MGGTAWLATRKSMMYTSSRFMERAGVLSSYRPSTGWAVVLLECCISMSAGGGSLSLFWRVRAAY